MRRSKAFILVEILTTMALQAGFIIVLCTSFYLMLSFYTRTQQTLNARQKAEKVIAYVDARIKNVGLGLQECESSAEIRDALCKVTELLKGQELTLPVAITSGDWNFREKDSDNKFRGNRLTLLRTERDSALNLIIRTQESKDENQKETGRNYPLILSSDKEAVDNNVFFRVGFILTAGSRSRYSKYNHDDSEFNQETDHSDRIPYLNSYTVMPGSGRPLYIGPVVGIKFNLYLFSKSSNTAEYTANICPGDELYYLKCERMLVEGNNFDFWRYGKTERKPKPAWYDSKKHHHELGILEIYFELDTSNNILDMYVLASGGKNDLRNTQRPAAWPSDFWKPEYRDYTIYMARASWKLKNLKPNFTWD